MLFFCSFGWGLFPLKVNAVEELAGKAVAQELRRKLKELFGRAFDESLRVPNISVVELETELPQFEEILLWIKRQIEEEAARRLSQ